MSGIWAIVPVKRLADSKSRLSPLLTADQRHNLSLGLLRHTLRQVAEFPGPARTLVVSRDETALELARAGNFAAIAEAPDADLNAALEQARNSLIGHNATALMIVAIDLPLLQADDLRALADAGSARQAAGLAGDRHGIGTNGLCLKPADLIPFRFGAGSLAAHRAALEGRGVVPNLVMRAGLALDIDTPEDLAELRAQAPHAVPPY